MDATLQEFSPTRLAVANEENLASWIPVLSELEGSQHSELPGVKRSISNIPLPLMNSIMDAQLTPGQVEPTIDYVIADAKSRHVPVLWWVGPSTHPVDLAERLVKYGFSIDEDGPGMAVNLDKLNESLPVAEGCTIHPALDDAAWWAWSRTLAKGFEVPAARVEFAVNSWHDLLRQVDPETTLGNTAWLNGTPVATSLLQLGGGVAGIYGVATVPEARRKGIGAQVTLYPLLQARAKGYKVGVLQASEMGLGVYRSLGFQECCRITSYIWRP